MCYYRLWVVIIISDMSSIDKMSKSRFLLLYSTNYILTEHIRPVLPNFFQSCVWVKFTLPLHEKQIMKLFKITSTIRTIKETFC
jgi:hypothetical protein